MRVAASSSSVVDPQIVHRGVEPEALKERNPDMSKVTWLSKLWAAASRRKRSGTGVRKPIPIKLAGPDDPVYSGGMRKPTEMPLLPPDHPIFSGGGFELTTTLGSIARKYEAMEPDPDDDDEPK